MSNWNLVTQNEYNANSLLQFLYEFDKSDIETWKKWKSNNNQVVVKTNDFYYKVYALPLKNNAIFQAKIRDELAKIYRDQFNILWNIKTLKNDEYLIQIEQREALEVCHKDNIQNFDNVFKKWRLTLLELEERLELPRISLQLLNEIPNLYRLKLVRECINNFEDYAITKNGDIVLLDDTDWFLALTDKEGNWFSHDAFTYEVSTNYNTYLFRPLKERFFTDLRYCDCLCDQWFLSLPEDFKNNKYNVKILTDIKNKMLNDNIRFLNNGMLDKNEHLIEAED